MAFRVDVITHVLPDAPVQVYTIDKEFDAVQRQKIAESLTNPVSQKYYIFDGGANDVGAAYSADLFRKSSLCVEVGFLPGVTDNVAGTARQLIEDLLGVSFDTHEGVYSSKIFSVANENDAAQFFNPLIQTARLYQKNAFDKIAIHVPKVVLKSAAETVSVDLDCDEAELQKIGKQGIADGQGRRRGPLGLDLLSMQAIRDHFKKIGRNPTDVEIETLAQTWSEHCKHTIFASPIDEIKDGIYRHFIKRATTEIRQAKGKDDICVSVFSDNAGGIIFDDEWLVCDKVETHNTPSALDPYGGAITGIGGVNRDCMGFGKGAKPVMNRYGFCFTCPEDEEVLYRSPDQSNPMLLPRAIMRGVIKGVEDGGNQSGIPTPQGFVYFNDRYKGKPLVFCGTIGLIPREINGQKAHEKKARPGDLIIVAGGRVGKDGIHGATFSSEQLDEGSPVTAVQIGDPITQKKLSDVLIKEARAQGLYNSITDNGAGGLSSSIGEMARESGGAEIWLDRVPLKYPGLQPWEIWISESQERMTLSVPEAKADQLITLLARRGVEATIIGKFTDTGRLVITHGKQTVMDMEMDFLHHGNPQRHLKTSYAQPSFPEPDLGTRNLQEDVLKILGRLNICSREFIATQYDHEVQAGSVLKPVQGKGRVFAEATVTKPVLSSPRGVILSQGVFPLYGDIDPYHMASAAIDVAIRNIVAAGGDVDRVALLDNFCWCSSDEPERLGQLKRAAQACYDFSTAYGAPFISGKDSMFNDFKGYDAAGNPLKISIPPTLLVSSIAVMDDVLTAISIDPKMTGDVVYLLGETREECGGSEYFSMLKHVGNAVPETRAGDNLLLYRAYHHAAKHGLIASAYPVGLGGVITALAKKAIAGQCGLDIQLPHINPAFLFSESTGRILVTVAPEYQAEFEKLMGARASKIGFVTDEALLRLNGVEEWAVTALTEVYKKRLENFG